MYSHPRTHSGAFRAIHSYYVWAAIEKLSYEHREIIILRHFEDLSYEEIAKLLGIAVGSVMSRLYYARKNLKNLLGDVYER